MTTKKCKQCSEEKSLDEFYRQPRSKPPTPDGLRTACRICIQSHQSRPAATARRALARQAQLAALADKAAAKKAAKHLLDEQARLVHNLPPDTRVGPADHFRLRTLRRHGLTPESFAKLIAKQDHRCAICQKDSRRQSKDFCIDHGHRTGQVRGILCHHCNLGLGHFWDSTASLAAAIQYLERSQPG